MKHTDPNSTIPFADLDQALATLAANKDAWVKTPVAERIAILAEIKERLMPVAQAWAETAGRKKGIPEGSPLVGEEWLSGPYTVLGYCNQMMLTLSQVDGKKHLDGLPVRQLSNGQTVARVLPHSLWDHLLLSGVKVDVWMEPGVTPQTLRANTAATYDAANPTHKQGKVALVLGAGNVAAIAPLDVFYKLFNENQVVILKMNPVNDYLIEFLEPAFKPLIDRGMVRIVRGGADVGQYLCNHALVDEIHITGSGASHDAIVWGVGEEGRANKAAGTPKNNRTIGSELGAVCPTIVVPGPWSAADIRFQAEQVATQKLHNSGFNCVACQILVVPQDWAQKTAFVQALEGVMASSNARTLYYPGAESRLEGFQSHSPSTKSVPRAGAAPVLVAPLDDNNAYARNTEVFAPALSVKELPGTDAVAYLKAAIEYANTELYGTLGANIVIHPATIAQIGRARFEELLIELRYGTIAINAWTGLGFLTPQATWGAFPGHTLDDVQSGIGVVHNTMLFDKPQRTVVEAPFRPFPRNLLSFSFTMLPRPPWFITNRKGAILGRLLVAFQYRPSLLKMPRIFLNALLG
ncbi:aldehyde dehydrogenase family protein [Rhodoferax saidenbachensis]|uniref:Aldehyde dehydrogenase n=1 Tax=Rhodoferax saidenbachensis TaxID=1484693 RepID=A0A1P8KG13_9BURK|nr:aldehyde dehydrogenase family protein [Rhodoferax saidenbachensis]APW44933.1 aldehyde dehydrogenase [Rhodoferax saidenbachensis]